jgi:phosphate transport system permease protein
MEIQPSEQLDPPPASEPPPARRRARSGEPWVWLCGAGLAVGVAMTLGLLGLIVFKGTERFWPRQIELVEYREGGEKRQIAGIVVGENPEEIQLFRGNKDLEGDAFRFLRREQVGESSHPPEVFLAERLEWGNAIGVPVALVLADRTRIDAAAEDFQARLDEHIDEAGERRDVIEAIEKTRIGKVNRAIEQLQLDMRAGRIDAEAGASRQAGLQAEYEALAAEARGLRQQQLEVGFIYRISDGRENQQPVSTLVHIAYPNQMGFFSKAGEAIRRVWAFLSEDPREANTEGGVFPAIFGTAIMTVVMSLMVTPFGVIAAIYLREYARQGMLVRIVRIAVNNLAGVPSIVFGVFGLAFFVYFVGARLDLWLFHDRLPTPTYGTGGIFWASLTLALLTLPVVVVATEEALAAVPRGVREAALACGASKWQMIQRVVLPASVPGILTGVILAMARGAGEVAPLMLVGVVKLAPTLAVDTVAPFIHPERKFMHLGFHIFDLGFQSPDSEAARPMVFATTLLLIVLVVAMNLTAILLRNRIRKRTTTNAF